MPTATRKVSLFWHPHYDIGERTSPLVRWAASVMAPTPFLKYAALKAVLQKRPGFKVCKAPIATTEDLLLVHSATFLAKLEEHAAEGLVRASWDIHRGNSAALDSDCAPFNEDVLDFFKAAVGGTCAALKHAYETGETTVNLAGGFHHASRSWGAGFCVLNDVAVAIRKLKQRTMVIDLDVHHGDGTVLTLGADTDVFTFSMHQRDGYPSAKPRGSLDVALTRGTEDDEYLEALEKWLPACLELFKPVVVLYLAGVDPLASDKLGLLSLTPTGLRVRDRLVFALCRLWEVPVAVVLGGGYSDLHATVAAHAATCAEALAYNTGACAPG